MNKPAADEIVIPPSIGTVTNRIAAGPGAPLVVHISDAHCKAPVQRNIAAIGRHLVQQHGFRLFAVEGTPGPIEVGFLRRHYAEAPAVVDQQLETGRITGPEWLAISHAHALTIHGIEDADAYRRNHQAMVGVMGNAQPARDCLSRLRGALLGLPGTPEMWANHALLGVLGDGISLHLTRDRYLAHGKALAKLDLSALVDAITTASKAVGEGISAGLPVARAVVADVLAFYETAIERDGILFRNAMEAMRRHSVDRAIVVTGGFHVGGIATLARERGVAAVFVQPQMAWTLAGLLNDGEEQKYKTIMAKQKV